MIVPPGLVAAEHGRPAGWRRAAVAAACRAWGWAPPPIARERSANFRATAGPDGLRSVGATDEPRSREVAVPVGETIELNRSPPSASTTAGRRPPRAISSTLMDVEEYTTNPRIRKALRSLATYGTSLGVAQSVMWRVCNDLPFEAMVEQAGKVMNTHEIALAGAVCRGTRRVDRASDLVDPSALSGGRIFVQVRGEGSLDTEARRLAGQLDGLRLLGLPLQIVESEELPTASAPAIFLNVILTDAKNGETRGRDRREHLLRRQLWLPLGKVAFRDNSSVNVLDGATLSKVIDRAVAGAFVTVKPARRTLGSTTLKVENRLPFTVTNLVVRAGTSSGAPPVAFEGVGVGPARSALLPIQAATASLVERVEINGLLIPGGSSHPVKPCELHRNGEYSSARSRGFDAKS